MSDPIALVKPRLFWAKVERRDAVECWRWLGRVDRQGYGLYNVARPKPLRNSWEFRAHRVAMDHLCRNTSCVNPAHLEPVTQRVNVQRGHRWGPPPAFPKSGIDEPTP